MDLAWLSNNEKLPSSLYTNNFFDGYQTSILSVTASGFQDIICIQQKFGLPSEEVPVASYGTCLVKLDRLDTKLNYIYIHRKYILRYNKAGFKLLIVLILSSISRIH